MGAPPGAESSDLSEWPRSVSDAAAPSARRAPGTATGVRKADYLNKFLFTKPSPGGKVARRMP